MLTKVDIEVYNQCFWMFQDADIKPSKAAALYQSLVEDMWIMYNVCNLVHADLSEFNLL